MKLFRASSSSEVGGLDSSSMRSRETNSNPVVASKQTENTKDRDELDDDLDALLGDEGEEKSDGLDELLGDAEVKQEEDDMQDSEVFEKGITEMTEEMKILADEKIQLADKVAELNEQFAERQSKMLSLEEDFDFRQTEMRAHIAKQEKQRDQLDEEVELLKQKIHLLASDIKQESAPNLPSVFRRQAGKGGERNPNEVEMQTWRMESNSQPNPHAVEEMNELKELFKDKDLECVDLRQDVQRLTAENQHLRDENARLRAQLAFEKENHVSVRTYSGEASVGSNTVGTTGTTGTAGNDLFISNLNDMMKQGVCLYEFSPLATNSKQIDFYLPKLKVFCPCGKHSVSDDSGMDDPTSLPSILRPWQLEFLKSAGITTTMHLLQASRHRASDVSKQMRRWRRKKTMPSFHTASCAVAVHIWSRTCIRVLKAVHQQKLQGRTKPVLPDFMEYKLDPDHYTVSSLGQFSLRTRSEDEGDSKSASRVLFGVPETKAKDDEKYGKGEKVAKKQTEEHTLEKALTPRADHRKEIVVM